MTLRPVSLRHSHCAWSTLVNASYPDVSWIVLSSLSKVSGLESKVFGPSIYPPLVGKIHTSNDVKNSTYGVMRGKLFWTINKNDIKVSGGRLLGEQFVSFG